jgi:anion-transporting  ArsA/GET3 family ATPase
MTESVKHLPPGSSDIRLIGGEAKLEIGGTDDGAERLREILASKDVVVVAGSGGVGKTSIAAALALFAASRLERKSLVVTIDPARRLATALGLSGLGNRAVPVDEDHLKTAGVECPGGLFAMQVDTKRSWDEMIWRYASSEEEAYRILGNRLYQGFSGRFVQSHDYIAMDRLYELRNSAEYDLIVVDTPPSRNALDFVEAPKRVQEFFGGRLLRLLTAPYRMGGDVGSRVINFATRPFYRIADQILGSKFLEDIAEFFLSFQSMYDGFVERATAVDRMLHDPRTAFVLVSTLEPAAFAEAKFFRDLLLARGFPLEAVVLNKVLPGFLSDRNAFENAGRLAEAELAARLEALEEGGPSAEALGRVLKEIADNFKNFHLVAMRQIEEARGLGSPSLSVCTVGYIVGEVSDLESLAIMAESMFGTRLTGRESLREPPSSGFGDPAP